MTLRIPITIVVDSDAAIQDYQSLSNATQKVEQAHRRLGGGLDNASKKTTAAGSQQKRYGNEIDVVGKRINAATAAQRRLVTGLDRSTQSAKRAAQSQRQLGDSSARAVRGQQRLNAATDSTNDKLQLLATRALGAFSVFYAGSHILRTLNSLGELDNRLSLVTDSAEELSSVRGQLLGIANEARASVFSVGTLYGRIGLAAGELGRTQQELLNVTALVTKAVALSGATAESASAGLVQFAQGLASNRLQGDELRSVLENLPGLAQAIADGLGVSLGEIRDLAAEGQLTANAVISAILSQSGKIESQYRNFTPTIAQGWEVFINGLSSAIDATDDFLDISSSLGGAFESIGLGLSFVFAESVRANRGIEEFNRALDALERNPDSITSDAISQLRGERAAIRGEIEFLQQEINKPVSPLAVQIPELVASQSERAESLKQDLKEAEEALERVNSILQNPAALEQENRRRSLAQSNLPIDQEERETARTNLVKQRLDNNRLIAQSEQDNYERQRLLARNRAQNEIRQIQETIKNEEVASVAISNIRLDLANRISTIDDQEAQRKEQIRLREVREEERLQRDIYRNDLAFRDREIDLIEDQFERERALAFRNLGHSLNIAQQQTDDKQEQLNLILLSRREHSAALRQIAIDEAQHEKDLLDEGLEAIKNYERQRVDAAFQIRGLAAENSASGLDNLQLDRDRDLQNADDAEEDGVRTPEEAEALRQEIWQRYFDDLEELRDRTETIGYDLTTLLFGPLSDSDVFANLSTNFDDVFTSLGAGEATLSGIAQSFRATALAAINSGDSVEDAVKRMVAAIAQRLAFALLEFAAISAIDAIATVFGLPQGTILKFYYGQAPGGGGSSSVDVTDDLRAGRTNASFHRGGIVGGRFAQEVPAVLQAGEGVFTPAQMRALAPVSQQGGNVTLNVINNSRAQVSVEESTEETADGRILHVVLNDLREGGVVAAQLTNQFNLKEGSK